MNRLPGIPTRRAIVRAGVALPLVMAGLPPGLAATLPVARSLREEAALAADRGRALVLMVSLEGCPYCRLVRDHYLAPLAAQGQPTVQIDWGRADRLLDFDGRATNHADFIERLGVRVTPTVLFVGRGGRELAPRLVGVSSVDFYGHYLDERIQSATRAL